MQNFSFANKVQIGHPEHVKKHDENELEQVWIEENRIRIEVESKMIKKSSVWSLILVSARARSTIADASTSALSVLSDSQPKSKVLVRAGFQTPGVSCGHTVEQWRALGEGASDSPEKQWLLHFGSLDRAAGARNTRRLTWLGVEMRIFVGAFGSFHTLCHSQPPPYKSPPSLSLSLSLSLLYFSHSPHLSLSLLLFQRRSIAAVACGGGRPAAGNLVLITKRPTKRWRRPQGRLWREEGTLLPHLFCFGAQERYVGKI